MVRTLTHTTCANLFFASYEALWMCGRTLCRKHEFSISYYCTYAERNTLRFAHGKGKKICTAKFHWQNKMHLSVANVKNRNISITHAWKKHESPRSHTQAKWQRTREICIYVVEHKIVRGKDMGVKGNTLKSSFNWLSRGVSRCKERTRTSARAPCCGLIHTAGQSSPEARTVRQLPQRNQVPHPAEDLGLPKT
jgi:hypothetical protein